MEIAKSDLEKEIAAIFKDHTPKERESEVAGVINGVLPVYFHQLVTGNWSEKYPTVGYMQREENKDAASNIISGFLWAMDAVGLISNEKRVEMQKQLSALRFPEHSTNVTYATDYEALSRKVAEQRAADEKAEKEQKAEAKQARCRNCENYQPYEPQAGLWAGCTAPEPYADENCQEIIPEVNDEITAYMRELGEGCPYFIDARGSRAAESKKRKREDAQ